MYDKIVISSADSGYIVHYSRDYIKDVQDFKGGDRIFTDIDEMIEWVTKNIKKEN